MTLYWSSTKSSPGTLPTSFLQKVHTKNLSAIDVCLHSVGRRKEKKVWKEQASIKASDGLAKHAKSQTTPFSIIFERVLSCADGKGISNSSPLCCMTIPDSNVCLDITERFDHASNVILDSRKAVKQVDFIRVGKLHAIKTVYLEVVLQKTKEGFLGNFLFSQN